MPNPDLFVYAFLRQEAALSSQIEGTEASLDDLFEYEAEPSSLASGSDVGEIVNYLNALSWGIDQLPRLPLSLRFIRELHKRLLASGRGASKNPGEFRDGQNHIGPPGCTIDEASFVPPAVPLMLPALADWERYLHDRSLPALVRAAIIHAQFETIHPFWDGNGRIGRMLITLMLVNEGVLERPLLYLSLFFKVHKGDYYERLQAVRDSGNWESWLEFFLRGVRATCRSALSTARRISTLRESTLLTAQGIGRSGNYARLADALFHNPYVTPNGVARTLGVTHTTGTNLIDKFVEKGLLAPTSDARRGRVYNFPPYVKLLSTAAIDLEAEEPPKSAPLNLVTETSGITT